MGHEPRNNKVYVWLLGLYVLLMGPISIVFGLIIDRGNGIAFGLSLFVMPAIIWVIYWLIWWLTIPAAWLFVGYFKLLQNITGVPLGDWAEKIVRNPKGGQAR